MRLTSWLRQQPEGYPSQQMPKGGKQWVAGRYWPIIGVTAITAGSMLVWLYRKEQVDVEGVPPGTIPGYGRKSAEATGMMEGDRAFQGVFPTKKITEKLEPILPASGQRGGSSLGSEENRAEGVKKG